MDQLRQIIHVDMDAFYASVEQMDNPQLKGKPLIVGATPQQRGVVAAASYEARRFGVHSAMPTSQAIRLCPDLIIMPVRMSRYSEISKQIHQLFYDYTDLIEPLSIDEAFLDVTGSIKLFGSAENIGKQIKKRIKDEIGLIASVGIAPNKFLAKLASDLEKPDGFVVITEENKQRILDPLPVWRIWGVGKVTAEKLTSNGIKTIGQLRNIPVENLKAFFGNQAEDILELCRGNDKRPVESIRDSKSISAEETFAKDIIDRDSLLHTLHQQVEEVAGRLRAEKLESKTITLKIRYKNFKTITRSHSLDEHTNVTQVLLEAANRVFEKWYKISAGHLRLLGFGVSNLRKEGTGQKLLFDETTDEKQKQIDNVVDKIRDKFGSDSLKRWK
jgi:DNA polymerase IV